MTNRASYSPGPANIAHVEKDGDTWTLTVVRTMHHAPEKVWAALTDPAQLQQWAPFDVDTNMGLTGTKVKLTTVGAPQAPVTETTIKRAEKPKLLEYTWGDQSLRWELEPVAEGTRLTLWHNINRQFISMGAAGWQICLDVLDASLGDSPLGRMVGPSMMGNEGWQRLNAEYAKQFGIELPNWGSKGSQ